MPRQTILMPTSARSNERRNDVMLQLQNNFRQKSVVSNVNPDLPPFSKTLNFKIDIPNIQISPRKILSARECIQSTSDEISDVKLQENNSKLYDLERQNEQKQFHIDNLQTKNQQLNQQVKDLQYKTQNIQQQKVTFNVEEIVEQNIRMEAEISILKDQISNQKPQIIQQVQYIQQNDNFKELYHAQNQQFTLLQNQVQEYKIEIQALKELFGTSSLGSNATPKERAIAMMSYKGIKSELVQILQSEIEDLKFQLSHLQGSKGTDESKLRNELFEAKQEIKRLKRELDSANGAFDEYIQMDLNKNYK